MLQQEFEQRVKMPVQAWEFEAINVVYNNSDLDKDEFCKMWRSMNKTRIERYNKKQAEKDYKEKMKGLLNKAKNNITESTVSEERKVAALSVINALIMLL